MRIRHFMWMLISVLGCPAWAGDAVREEALAIPTRPGVSMAFFLDEPDPPPVAAAILFSGGAGSVGIHPGEAVAEPAPFGRGNFLVRTRRLLAAQGILVATVDPPSDQEGSLTAAFRLSADHAADIGALAGWLKGRGGGPVWLVGTSMGTLSAANAAIRLGGKVDGIVLTSTITVGNRNQSYPYDGVLGLGLEQLAIPALVMAHAADTCWATPPRDAERLLERLETSPRKAMAWISGGAPAKSAACEAMSPHGYFGREDEAVAAIAAFIKGQPTPPAPDPAGK